MKKIELNEQVKKEIRARVQQMEAARMVFNNYMEAVMDVNGIPKNTPFNVDTLEFQLPPDEENDEDVPKLPKSENPSVPKDTKTKK